MEGASAVRCRMTEMPGEKCWPISLKSAITTLYLTLNSDEATQGKEGKRRGGERERERERVSEREDC